MSKPPYKKPETIDEQVSLLWDTMHNHVLSNFYVLNLKVNALLVLFTLTLALLGVEIARG